MTAPATRWALSPTDFTAHAVDESLVMPPGLMVARCGHAMPAEAGLDDVPRAALCPGCVQATVPLVDPATPETAR